MDILTGFPPSNTISPGTYIPDIVRTKIKIGNLEPEQKFVTKDEMEFMRLSNDMHGGIKAICYKGGPNHEAGTVYCFDRNVEVFWLRPIYIHAKFQRGMIIPADCCQRCGTKLICDDFSTKYGDWCPNENCH